MSVSIKQAELNEILLKSLWNDYWTDFDDNSVAFGYCIIIEVAIIKKTENLDFSGNGNALCGI